MILSPAELVELTKRQRRDAQAKQLRFMGIEHKLRSDGTLAVSRAHAERELGGGAQTRPVKAEAPNWDAI